MLIRSSSFADVAGGGVGVDVLVVVVVCVYGGLW